jgi:hypothetical protein
VLDKIKWEIMREHKGLNGNLDRLLVLMWVMLLKVLGDLEPQREQEASFAGAKFRPAIEPRRNHLPHRGEGGVLDGFLRGGRAVILVLLFERQRLLLALLDAVGEPVGRGRRGKAEMRKAETGKGPVGMGQVTAFFEIQRLKPRNTRNTQK